MIDRFDSDGLFKDILQQGRTVLLDALARGVAVRGFRNADQPAVLQRRVDLVAELADDSLLHIEFQSRNDRYMLERMAMYHLVLLRRFRRPLRHVVLYVGQPPMSMKPALNTGPLRFACEVTDIRSFDVDIFLAAGRPSDCVLATLAGNAEARLGDIMDRLRRLPVKDLQYALPLMSALSQLRPFSVRLKRELKNMPVILDLSKNVIIRDVLESTRAEGVAEGGRRLLTRVLEGRFGRLPVWATSRIAKLTFDEVEELSQKAGTAPGLEDVLGPRSRKLHRR